MRVPFVRQFGFIQAVAFLKKTISIKAKQKMKQHSKINHSYILLSEKSIQHTKLLCVVNNIKLSEDTYY